MSDFIIDLSHPLSPTMPLWPGDPATRIEPAACYRTHGYHLNTVSFGEHSGTHVGVPGHFLPSGADAAQFPAEKLIGPAVNLDVSAPADRNPDYLLTVQDIARWESAWGAIAVQSLVLVTTGWCRHWQNAARYLGIDAAGQMHFPGVTDAAARFLVQERAIAGIGIDTAGIDGGMSTSLAANRLLADAGALHLENLHNLTKVPAKGATVFIGLLPISGGSGSPARVLALLAGRDARWPDPHASQRT